MLKAIILGLIITSACGGSKSGGGDAIGIKECDDYVAKATACASKLGDKGKGLESQTKSIADAWRKDAKDSAMKAEMAKTCSEAITGAKAAYPDCAF